MLEGKHLSFKDRAPTSSVRMGVDQGTRDLALPSILISMIKARQGPKIHSGGIGLLSRDILRTEEVTGTGDISPHSTAVQRRKVLLLTSIEQRRGIVYNWCWEEKDKCSF